MDNNNNKTHSSDLLNIPGKTKTIAKLLSDQTQEKPSAAAIPSLEERKTFKIKPNNDILSRVQAFLPQIQQANQQLNTMDPKDLDIENVQEDKDQYIEMNLGLGVYDLKPKTSISDDEEDEEEDDIIIPNTSGTTNINYKNGIKPSIELLNQKDDSDEEMQ
ncbi:hypothetical protein BJ944DRAFT_4353 [Cunninghamella echinulata]|nr:hypothetical protein BJ944DRAFT_4353 [Cunninghamella echinulata]